MALVLWTYSNPYVDRNALEVQQFTFQGHFVELPQDSTVEIDVTKNTGFKLWDGAYLLARYLESEDFPAGRWRGRRCVELGAGCGLVGIVAWLLGAKVTLTDLEDAIAHTRKCVDKNTSTLKPDDSGEISTQVLLWGDEPSGLPTPADVILGSDIVYQPDYLDDLIKTLNDLSGPQTVIYISYKPRGLGEDVFFDKLQKSFSYTTVPRDRYPKDFCQSPYVIYRIVKKWIISIKQCKRYCV